ncbi:hypothetical protein BGZ67_000207, partial [Mortierella alpina]
MTSIEAIAAACVWAHKEICLEFSQNWEQLGAIKDVLIAGNVNKENFSTTFEDVRLLAFYTNALHLLEGNVRSLSTISKAVSYPYATTTGRKRSCFAGWIAGIAVLAILRFYQDSSVEPTVKVELVSVKSTMLPKLTTRPWDMTTVENLQVAGPMITDGAIIREPG